MRFCFYIGWGMLAAAAWAADVNEPRRITSMVRTDTHTGRLVRSVAVTPHSVTGKVIAPMVVSEALPAPEKPAAPVKPAAQRTAPPSGIDEAVERIAAEHVLPAALIHSVIQVESNYNPLAVSSAGARGLMQLIPATARRFGVNDVFNPLENIQGGARYLRYLLTLYHGNYALALAAYNAGEANVARYGNRVPPFAETQNYLVLVKKQLEERKRQAAEADRKMREAQAKPAETKAEPGVNHITEVVGGDGTVRYVTR